MIIQGQDRPIYVMYTEHLPQIDKVAFTIVLKDMEGLVFRLFVYSLFFTFISLIVLNQIVSHEIRDKVRELNNLNISLKKEKDREIILKTDWIVRTSPERLQKLSEHYYPQLMLSPSKGENIKFINQEIDISKWED